MKDLVFVYIPVENAEKLGIAVFFGQNRLCEITCDLSQVEFAKNVMLNLVVERMISDFDNRALKYHTGYYRSIIQAIRAYYNN